MAPGYNPYGSIAPPATAPYYAPPAIAPPSGYAPQAHPYTPYPYTNPKEELQRRYAAMMDEYGRLLSQDLPDEKFRELVQETEAMIAVERAKHQLADAVRILEMVQRDFRKAKAADDAVRLLKLLPNSKDLKLEHQDVPSPSPTSEPKAPEKRKPTSETSPSNVKKDGTSVVVPSGLRLRCKGDVLIAGNGFKVKAAELDLVIDEKRAKTADLKALGLRLRCAGDVVIEEGNEITAKAAELQYDAVKNLLILSTDCTLWSRNSNGKTSISKAKKMILDLQTGEIDMRNEHH
jgi:lipopolysaccharide export system protein LptA